MALTMEQHFEAHHPELYVNSIYSADGYEGIGSASQLFLAKPPCARCRRMHRCWLAS